MVDITKAMGVPKLALRTIRKQAEKITESFKSATTTIASKITQIWVRIRTLIQIHFSTLTATNIVMAKENRDYITLI
jgi:ATP-dependent DNA ligase